MGLINSVMVTAREGQRNERLYSVARTFLEAVKPPAAFEALAAAALNTGLSPAEVYRTIESARQGHARGGGENVNGPHARNRRRADGGK